jgi:hypothetical protein
VSDLDPLVGEWGLEATFPVIGTMAGGRVTDDDGNWVLDFPLTYTRIG